MRLSLQNTHFSMGLIECFSFSAEDASSRGSSPILHDEDTNQEEENTGTFVKSY